ncbi:MAG TPA: alternative ribosome rescue aminoacyl-tRNA hydrolase ArfB [Pirellulales bacterium]|nr:alternative ribosome rescue aminoacyl-tRNA hydrolase ArfB [Pirellulales bacterium]
MQVPPGISVPDSEFQFTFVRSSGPGGQNVNKVNTKAVLRWPVTASPSLMGPVRSRFLSRFASRLTTEGELVLSSQRFRDQAKNRDDCLEKVRAMLEAVAVAPIRRRKTRPSRASVERRLTQKRQLSGRKQQRRQRPRGDSE